MEVRKGKRLDEVWRGKEIAQASHVEGYCGLSQALDRAGIKRLKLAERLLDQGFQVGEGIRVVLNGRCDRASFKRRESAHGVEFHRLNLESKWSHVGSQTGTDDRPWIDATCFEVLPGDPENILHGADGLEIIGNAKVKEMAMLGSTSC